VFDGLADFIDRHFRPSVITDLIRDPAPLPTDLDSRVEPADKEPLVIRTQ
jgi:hypothetical protein